MDNNVIKFPRQRNVLARRVAFNKANPHPLDYPNEGEIYGSSSVVPFERAARGATPAEVWCAFFMFCCAFMLAWQR